jgi:hypothetical protein
MARYYYETTIALPDAADGYALKPLSNVKVSVVTRGATDLVNSLVKIYPADTGAAQGPDPKAGTSGGHPFTTGASGSVRFWADGPAELDIVFEDLAVPVRVTDRVGWNAVPSKGGSIPTSFLASDAGITQAMLSPLVVQQQVPIGGVINWWRPAQGVALPAGYEVADGRALTSDKHEFAGVAGGITLPNLMNVFILGADATKPDGTGAGAVDGAASAPGVRGSGGANAAKNLAHSHQAPMIDHYHNFVVPDHTHNSGGLYTGNHSHAIGTTDGSNSSGLVASGASPFSRTGHTHGGGTDVAGNIGVGGQVAWVGATHGGLPGGNTTWITAWGAGQNGYTTTVNTFWTAEPVGGDFRPAFYGLVRLVKVRRTA